MPLRAAAAALILASATSTAACAHPRVVTPPDAAAAGAFSLAMELQADGDAEAVLRRIRSAARLACGAAPPGGEAARRRDDCVADTVDRAVRALGDARLERLHRQASAGEARP